MKFAKTDVSVVAEHVWQKHHQMDFQSTTILPEKIIYKDIACWSPGSYKYNTTARISCSILHTPVFIFEGFIFWPCTFVPLSYNYGVIPFLFFFLLSPLFIFIVLFFLTTNSLALTLCPSLVTLLFSHSFVAGI